MVLVTFKNSNNNLVSMFANKFKNATDAKLAIERDASAFVNAHRLRRGDSTAIKFRQRTRWVNPQCEDYYYAMGQDGVSCVWQYFTIPA